VDTSAMTEPEVVAALTDLVARRTGVRR
jgi:hypothetical protein